MIEIETVAQKLFNGTETKIIAPIVARTKEELLQQSADAERSACDIVEWRIDYYEEVEKSGVISKLTHEVKNILSKPLLVTFRTLEEGGERELSRELYQKNYIDIVENGSADFIDVELFIEKNTTAELLKKARQHDVEVIMSSHDFEATPAKEEIIRRLKSMDEKGADICKIAVMPQDAEDVLTLFQATVEAKRLIQKPLITMSMGELGKISRAAGVKFGSAATFGALGETSAPGQIEVNELKNVLRQLNS